jgi:hypothetical protein
MKRRIDTHCSLIWLLAATLAGCAAEAGPGGPGDGDGDADGDGDGDGTTEDEILWQPIDLSGAPDLGHEAMEIPAADQIAAGPLALTEVADDLGLGGSSAAGNAHGVGVGFFDIDGDGFDDIFLATGLGTASQVYRNDGGGGFSDVSGTSGVAGILGSDIDCYSVSAADYDADGDLDVHVTCHPRDYLLANNGSGQFLDVTLAAGAGGPPSQQPGTASKIGAWGDVDGDGLLDIAVAGRDFCDSGACSYLLQNNGDGTFSDVTADAGFAVAASGNPCAVMWSDIDADGDQDIWVWNDRGSSTENRALLRNDGGRFTNITGEAGITNNVGNPMGIDGADVDHDGDLDYYVSDIGGNALYLARSDGTYAERAREAQAAGEYGWGLGFEDFDLDSWADIFVAQEDERPYLTFRNQQVSPPAFIEQAWAHGPIGNGHNVAVAFADFNQDGRVDVVTAGTSGTRMNLFRNDTDVGTNRWLEVRVPVTPGTGEHGGISGRVVVKTGALLQFRDLSGGSSRASQNAMSVRFGLGQWTGAEWVAVLWPDGRQLAVTGVEGNQILELPAP